MTWTCSRCHLVGTITHSYLYYHLSGTRWALWPLDHKKRGILWLRLHISDHESQLSPLSTALNAVESKHRQTLCVENLTPEVGFFPSSLLHLFLLTSHSSFLLIEVNHCLCKTLFWALAEARWVGHAICAWRASCLLWATWVEVETLVPGYHSFYFGELLRLSWGQGTSCLPISTYTILLFTTIGGCNLKESIYFSRGNDAKAGG